MDLARKIAARLRGWVPDASTWEEMFDADGANPADAHTLIEWVRGSKHACGGYPFVNVSPESGGTRVVAYDSCSVRSCWVPVDYPDGTPPYVLDNALQHIDGKVEHEKRLMFPGNDAAWGATGIPETAHLERVRGVTVASALSERLYQLEPEQITTVEASPGRVIIDGVVVEHLGEYSGVAWSTRIRRDHLRDLLDFADWGVALDVVFAGAEGPLVVASLAPTAPGGGTLGRIGAGELRRCALWGAACVV